MRLTRDRGNLHPQCFERRAICRQQDGKAARPRGRGRVGDAVALAVLIAASDREGQLRLDVGQSFGEMLKGGPHFEQPKGHLGQCVNAAKPLLRLEETFLVGPLARVD